MLRHRMERVEAHLEQYCATYGKEMNTVWTNRRWYYPRATGVWWHAHRALQEAVLYMGHWPPGVLVVRCSCVQSVSVFTLEKAMTSGN